MKFNKDMLEKKWVAYSIATCSAVLLYFLLLHIPTLFHMLGTIFSYFFPVLLGVVMAMILNPLMMFFERTILKKIKNHKLTRAVAVVFTMITVFLLMTLLLLAFIPQLVDSITSFFNQWDVYEKSLDEMIRNVTRQARSLHLDISGFQEISDKVIAMITKYAQENMDSIVDTSYNVGMSIVNIVLGLILAIYFLFDKERLKNSAKRLHRALFPRRIYQETYDFFKRCYQILIRYVGGDLLDAFIVSIINFIFMTILGMPYSLLISFFVGITNLCPTFGPIVGGLLGAFILVLDNPWYALWFLIFTLILQTLDGYVIKPKLFGDTFGVPSVWILVMIIVGGRIFGFWGIMLAIPFTAMFAYVFETFLRKLIDKRNEEKLAEGK
ncbi:MAG: AI-2E family transporter [Lachnospiraceae bacterium]